MNEPLHPMQASAVEKLRRLRVGAQGGRLGLCDRLDTKGKINDMTCPDDREDHTWHQKPLAQHEEKADRHQQRYRQEDTGLGTHRHAFFLHEGVKVLFVHLRADEPVVQPLR